MLTDSNIYTPGYLQSLFISRLSNCYSDLLRRKLTSNGLPDAVANVSRTNTATNAMPVQAISRASTLNQSKVTTDCQNTHSARMKIDKLMFDTPYIISVVYNIQKATVSTAGGLKQFCFDVFVFGNVRVVRFLFLPLLHSIYNVNNNKYNKAIML